MKLKMEKNRIQHSITSAETLDLLPMLDLLGVSGVIQAMSMKNGVIVRSDNAKPVIKVRTSTNPNKMAQSRVGSMQ